VLEEPARCGRSVTAGLQAEDVTVELLAAGRAMSSAAVMFHSVLAAKQGLSATEEKSLDFLQRFGPLTAGELADKSGLAPPSVTGLIDRLEKRGFVRRVPDPEDGRRVRVQLNEERLSELAPLFADLVQEMETLSASYTVEQLEVIVRFLNDAARRQLAAAGRLTSAANGSAGVPPGRRGRRANRT